MKQLLEQAESERNKLRELLVRHSELEKVERSIVEVRDMFLRISTLVIEQVFFQFPLSRFNIYFTDSQNLFCVHFFL